MKFAIITLVCSTFASTTHETALVQDLLKRGRAPEKVFKPFDKTGSPDLFKES